MFIKEIIQLVSIPVLFYFAYRLGMRAYNKLESRNLLK